MGFNISSKTKLLLNCALTVIKGSSNMQKYGKITDKL